MSRCVNPEKEGEPPSVPHSHDQCVVRIVLDKANRVGFASSSIEDVLGQDYEEVVGMPIADILPQMAIEEFAPLHKTRMSALRALSARCEFAVHADGRKVPVIVTLKNEDTDAGSPPILLISKY